MIVTIHQPEHIPWLGFFNKAMNCDCFVILDNVQYRQDYFQNRNKIISNNDSQSIWLTIPIKKGPYTQLINEKIIAFDNKSLGKYFNLIKNSYQGYPFYDKYINDIKNIFYNEKNSLSKLNIRLIKFFFLVLKINCKTIISSSLNIPKSKTGGIINYDICKFLNAETYLSGKSGKDYLDLTPFKKNNIEVFFQDFNHPTYNQPRDNFVPNLSILDLLFSHEINDIKELIKSSFKLK